MIFLTLYLATAAGLLAMGHGGAAALLLAVLGLGVLLTGRPA